MGGLLLRRFQQTFTANGTWTGNLIGLPQAYTWGPSGTAAPGNGSNAGGGGAGAGSFGGEPALAGVAPAGLTVTVGGAGSGVATTITGGSVTVTGNHGGNASTTTGGTAGAASANTIAFAGGVGGNSASLTGGGGGGGSGGSTGAGGNGGAGAAGGGTAGAAGTGTAGLAGAAGGTGGNSSNGNGGAGTAPGGGPGGGGTSTGTAGAASAGQAIVRWSQLTVILDQPRPPSPRRGFSRGIIGSFPAAVVTPGTPNRQPPTRPRARPPARGLSRGRAAPGLPVAAPNRQPPMQPRARIIRRAVLSYPARPVAPFIPPAGGPPVFVDDGRPWLKRHRVKWYRQTSPLDWWYGSEIPAGVASAHEAGGRVGEAGHGQAAADVAAEVAAGPAIPDPGAEPDRRVRRRAKLSERIRGGDGSGRPVWSRDAVVPAAGSGFDHDRSERLLELYRLPGPAWRSSREYSFPVAKRRR